MPFIYHDKFEKNINVAKIQNKNIKFDMREYWLIVKFLKIETFVSNEFELVFAPPQKNYIQSDNIYKTVKVNISYRTFKINYVVKLRTSCNRLNIFETQWITFYY